MSGVSPSLAVFAPQKQEARLAALQAEVEKLREELGADEDPDKIIKHHIDLLHRYNEAKDSAQILIGRLAALKNSTIKQIHMDYDLLDAD
ncbi:hypothetical protein FISHEDRAFT_71552 [Fistulina hepatica ATCC 64428]|uniref:Swi5-domain-containing protein n=1 Tax=Fistulina hepatica ATCC 64428 TaxID=1128425 RepID=A0A0D7AI32_9AGAR|nr:hypothetical protein FISHEDRAFT_71552 [Fistulina hepatica ATCC 64428]